MRHRSRSLRSLSFAVALAYLLCFVPTSPVWAAWVGSEQALTGDKARLVSLVERQEVQQAMQELGVDPAEATRRAHAMTDAEARAAMNRLDSMPAGGNALGVLVGAAIFIFIVLLITDILGFTDIFPFVNPIEQPS